MEYDPAIFQAQIVRTVLKLQSNWKDSRLLSLSLDLKDGVERKKEEGRERAEKKEEKNDGGECLLRGE